MTETRAALSDKLEALEDRILGTVTETTAAVAETVDTVKEAVANTVTSVSETVTETVESVKETFDLAGQVQRHPWLAFGSTVLLSFLGTHLLSQRSPPTARTPPVGPPAPTEPSTDQELGTHWLSVLAPVTTALNELAIGTTTGVLGRMALDALPDSVQGAVQRTLDRMTEGLGGQPIHFER
jgi:hypothetical protein